MRKPVMFSMSASFEQAANTALQRTPPASPLAPLSSGTFGDSSHASRALGGLVLVLMWGCQSATSPRDTCDGTGTTRQGYGSDLVSAAGSGDLPGVQALIARGADVNSQECEDMVRPDGSSYKVFGWTPVMIASAHGYDSIVRLLAAAGADLAVGAVGQFANPHRGGVGQPHHLRTRTGLRLDGGSGCS